MYWNYHHCNLLPLTMYTVFYKGNFFLNLVFPAYKVSHFGLTIVKSLRNLMFFGLIRNFVLNLPHWLLFDSALPLTTFISTISLTLPYLDSLLSLTLFYVQLSRGSNYREPSTQTRFRLLKALHSSKIPSSLVEVPGWSRLDFTCTDVNSQY